MLADFAGVTGVGVDLDDRIYLVSPLGARELRRWNPLSGQFDLVSAGRFFVTPGRLAFEPTGELLVSDADTAAGPDGRLIRVDPDVIDTGNPGRNQALLGDGGDLVDPGDVAVGRLGPIYTSDVGAEAGAGAIYGVDRASGATSLVAWLGGVVGLDVFRSGAKRGDIAVADVGSQSVVLVEPATGGQRLLLPLSVGFPVDVEWEADGDLLVPASGGGSKFRVLSIGVVPDDGDFVVGTTDAGFGSFDVVRVDRLSKARTVLTSDGDVSNPSDLVIDAGGGAAYVASSTGGGGTGAVTAAALATGAQTVISAPGALLAPQGLARALEGALLVSDRPFVSGGFMREGRVQRLPLPFGPGGSGTGGATASLVSAGGLLQDPQGLSVFAPEPGGGALAAVAALALLAAARPRVGRR